MDKTRSLASYVGGSHYEINCLLVLATIKFLGNLDIFVSLRDPFRRVHGDVKISAKLFD